MTNITHESGLTGARRLATGTPTDWILGGVGITMAAASASFAAYMIATAPSEVRGYGSKDFPIFTALDRRAPGRLATHGPSQVARATVGAPAEAPSPSTSPVSARARLAGQGLDFTPTGSIAASPNAPPTADDAAPPVDYHIRDVFGDRALIEHDGRLRLVGPGAVLAGIGEVTAIEHGEHGWVIRTTGGTISGP